VPDLSHLWQRFLLACALLFGLALGIGATIFGYSNTAPVSLGWSVFHLNGVPLWTVALVPLAVVLVAGTAYHWLNSLHHFSEHMRHRHRVRELEAELASLRAHLDELLGMSDHSTAKVPSNGLVEEAAPLEGDATPAAALSEPGAANGEDRGGKKARKRVSVTTASEPETVAVSTDGAKDAEPLESNPDA
jgi:hypothetical protein